MARAFVIRPFNQKQDSAGNVLDFEVVHEQLIGPALKEFHLAGSTTGEVVEPGNIREDMFALLIEADLVVCDITIHNANVFYELGIRQALRKRRTVLIKGAPAADSTPFDILTDRYVPYDTRTPGAALKALVAAIRGAFSSERETDSPIFKMLPTLPEADPASVQTLPVGFREDVERARAAGSKGWLRLLAHEVRGLRFERIALQLIADVLWKLGDYSGARETFERIRETMPDDPAVNLSLANIYERLARPGDRPELLTMSDQAIARVLAITPAPPAMRVEALSLQGRNCKTRWRQQFDLEPDLARRRTAAMSEKLREAFEAYRDAYRHDLNHYWSGVAALQMGVIFLDLTRNDDWKSSFDDDGLADEYARMVESEVASLKVVVAASVDAAAFRRPAGDPDRVWAEVSRADLLFLSDGHVSRVVRRYLDAVPVGTRFVWDAVKTQLQLFAKLGIGAPVVDQVVAAVEARARPAADPDTPRHIVVFTGHRFDEPTRATPRFPEALEAAAAQAIRAVIERLRTRGDVVGFASASVGGDLLFHEACRALGVPSTICLPMPVDDYLAAEPPPLAFRERVLALFQERPPQPTPTVRQLNNGPGLPKWLQGSHTNEWERSNRWTLEMAVTDGSPTVTLIALWDQQAEDGRCGTAHMVGLARGRSEVSIELIPVASLTHQG